MNQDLGLSQTAFGFGAGIFFIAYFIFEVPSNLLLERFGARKWIARAVCDGVDQGPYRQLRGRAACCWRRSASLPWESC